MKNQISVYIVFFLTFAIYIYINLFLYKWMKINIKTMILTSKPN